MVKNILKLWDKLILAINKSRGLLSTLKLVMTTSDPHFRSTTRAGLDVDGFLVLP